jgi:nucleotide-binding universal stress UspA family protein
MSESNETLQRSRYRKILVPIDGSGWSQRAIPHAQDIARSNNAEIILLHIFSPPTQAYTADIELAGQTGAVDEMREWVAQYLAGLKAEMRDQNVPASIQMIESRDVPATICTVIERENVDLVVMSTHGRTGVARMLFGSVAKSVMERTDVPVLLVRPDKEDGL